MLDFDEKNNKLISDECYFFHCPYCDFKADDQLFISDHVLKNKFLAMLNLQRHMSAHCAINKLQV